MSNPTTFRQLGLDAVLAANRYFRQRPNFFVIVMLLALSWYATTVGAITLLSGGSSEAPFALRVFVGVFVAVLTVVMKLMLDRMLFTRGISRFIALPGYILLLVFSILFGFAWWWERMSAANETFDRGTAEIAAASRTLSNTNATLSSLTTELDRLAEYSRTMAEREVENGFTCESTAVGGPGEGPRMLFRIREAERYEQDRDRVSGEVTVLQNQIDELNAQFQAWETAEDTASGNTEAARLARIEQVRTLNNSMDEIVINYERIRNDELNLAGLPAEYRQSADAYISGSVRTGPSPNQAGVVEFRCIDPDLGNQLDRMADSIDELEPLGFSPIESFDLGARATVAAFERLTATLYNVPNQILNGNEPPTLAEETERRERVNRIRAGLEDSADIREGPGLQRGDWVPLGFTVLVDMSVLLLTLLSSVGQRNLLHREEIEHEAVRRSNLRASEYFSNMRMLEKHPPYLFFRNYLYRHRGDFFLAVPRAVSNRKALSEDDRAINTLAMQLAAQGHIKASVAFFEFKPDQRNKKVSEFLEMQGSKATGRQAYDLYKIDPEFLRLLHVHMSVDYAEEREKGDEDSEKPV